MSLSLKSLGLGFGITAAIFAMFHFAGPWFFLDGRRPFQFNFAAGAMLGLVLGLLTHHVLQIPGKAATQAMTLVAVPGMLIMAAVGSHFAVFFPHLDPALDKVFGSLMLWFYGFSLAGALWTARRA
jgi:tetrahydromethanopterin S-methyltransferase subunit C